MKKETEYIMAGSCHLKPFETVSPIQLSTSKLYPRGQVRMSCFGSNSYNNKTFQRPVGEIKI